MKKILGVILFCMIIVVGIVALIIYKNVKVAKDSNVLIETTIMTPFGQAYGIGSGVIIDDEGTVITAKHVLNNALLRRVTFNNGDSVIVNNVATDVNSDLAIIKTGIETPYYSTFGDAENLSYGNIVFGIGAANGILDNYWSTGIIINPSFKRMFFKDKNTIMVYMRTYPGCSGGGVYSNGKLIGITLASKGKYTFVLSATEIQSYLESIGEKD